MELFDVVSTTIPFLLLKTPAAVYAPQEQQDLANLRQQADPEPPEQQKPAGPHEREAEDASKPVNARHVTAPKKEQRKAL